MTANQLLNALFNAGIVISVGAVVLQLVKIVAVPLWAGKVVTGASISAWDIVKSLLALVLIPLVVGLFVRARYADHAKTWEPEMVKAANLALWPTHWKSAAAKSRRQRSSSPTRNTSNGSQGPPAPPHLRHSRDAPCPAASSDGRDPDPGGGAGGKLRPDLHRISHVVAYHLYADPLVPEVRHHS